MEKMYINYMNIYKMTFNFNIFLHLIKDELNRVERMLTLLAWLCSNHKLNNACKAAIASHLILPAYVLELNPFLISNKNCTNLNRDFEKLKCRLR